MASLSPLISVTLSLLLLAFFKLSRASVAIQPATVHPGRPNACFNNDENSYREDGESWQIAGCGMATCVGIPQPSGKPKMMISFEGCGKVGHEPGCHVIEDKHAEYPDCCPEVVCSSVENEADVDDFAFHNSIAAKDASTTVKQVGQNERTPSFFAPQDISAKKTPSSASSWDDEDDFQSLDERRAPSRNNYAIFSSEEEPSFGKSNSYDEGRQKDLFRLKFSPIPFYWV